MGLAQERQSLEVPLTHSVAQALRWQVIYCEAEFRKNAQTLMES